MIHETTYRLATTDPTTGARITHTHTVTTAVEPVREYVTEYRRCRKHHHRSDAAEARCLWKHAEWIAGRGRWATLAGCDVLTIVLHQSKDAALASLAAIDQWGCGHRCPPNPRHKAHRLVLLTGGAK